MEKYEHNESAVVDIADALPTDAKAIAIINKLCWLDTYPNKEFGITKDDILAKELGGDAHALRWQNAIEKKDAKTFVARLDGEVIGYCFVKKEAEQNRLGALYVLSSSHGKGVGRKLVEKAISFLGREKPIVLEVVTYNVHALNFYKKLGFRESGREIDEAQIMRLPSGIALPEVEMILPARNPD